MLFFTYLTKPIFALHNIHLEKYWLPAAANRKLGYINFQIDAVYK